MSIETRRNAAGVITGYRAVVRRPGERRREHSATVRTKPEARAKQREMIALFEQDARLGPAPAPTRFEAFAAR